MLFAFEDGAPDFLTRFDEIYYRDVDALGGTPLENIYRLQVEFLRLHADEPVLA